MADDQSEKQNPFATDTARAKARQGSFSPWKRPLGIGSLLLLTGGLTLYYSLHSKPLPFDALIAGFGQLVIAGLLLKNGLIRWNGKQVELSSVRGLKLPSGWSGHHSYQLPQGGDVDILVEAPNGDRFAVEIKSIQSLTIKQPFLGIGKMVLTDHAGRTVREDPFPQTIRNAHAVAAQPVLWLPKAQGKTLKLRNGVTVVYGPGKSLLKAMGAPSGWALW